MPRGPRLIRRRVEHRDAGALAVDVARIVAPVREHPPHVLPAALPRGVDELTLLPLRGEADLVIDAHAEGPFLRVAESDRANARYEIDVHDDQPPAGNPAEADRPRLVENLRPAGITPFVAGDKPALFEPRRIGANNDAVAL